MTNISQELTERDDIINISLKPKLIAFAMGLIFIGLAYFYFSAALKSTLVLWFFGKFKKKQLIGLKNLKTYWSYIELIIYFQLRKQLKKANVRLSVCPSVCQSVSLWQNVF